MSQNIKNEKPFPQNIIETLNNIKIREENTQYSN